MGECHFENKSFTIDRSVMGFWDTDVSHLSFLVRDGGTASLLKTTQAETVTMGLKTNPDPWQRRRK